MNWHVPMWLVCFVFGVVAVIVALLTFALLLWIAVTLVSCMLDRWIHVHGVFRDVAQLYRMRMARRPDRPRETQKLKELARIYCTYLSDDPQEGSTFDIEVLDALRYVGTKHGWDTGI